ncbi:hypothetical protein AUK22_07585 [bacterium CG2_30_54_10]|nr:MAG: hypothetical protein AUK22_07585 [bacterium CG2_30_54_10]
MPISFGTGILLPIPDKGKAYLLDNLWRRLEKEEVRISTSHSRSHSRTRTQKAVQARAPRFPSFTNPGLSAFNRVKNYLQGNFSKKGGTRPPFLRSYGESRFRRLSVNN